MIYEPANGKEVAHNQEESRRHAAAASSKMQNRKPSPFWPPAIKEMIEAD